VKDPRQVEHGRVLESDHEFEISIGPPWQKNTKVNLFAYSEMRRSVICSGAWALSCLLIDAMSMTAV
jgi:hypothetical protein